MAEASVLVKVRESEYKPLLDREQPTADIREHLGPWISTMCDVTNYGAKLIPRCIVSSKRKLEDAVLVATLLRQVVAMLDGIGVLLSNGAIHAANLQMRALFEASVYVDWILESDSEKKTHYYYVHNLRRMRVWASRTQSGSPESQEFSSVVKEFGVRIDDSTRDSAKETIREIDRVLSKPKFAAIHADFNKSRKGKREPAWYVPLGQPSFASICRAVGRGSLYVLLYSGASEVMHSSNYGHHVQFGENRLTIQPIRSAEGFETVFRFSLSIVLHTYMRIWTNIVPGNVPHLVGNMRRIGGKSL